MLAEIVGKALEGLFIAPGRTQTVNPTVVLVIFWEIACSAWAFGERKLGMV